MLFETWVLYFMAVLILTASPGPSALLCMTKAVSSGWRAGVWVAMGSLTAITLMMTLSFVGLGVLISSSETLFNLIKWGGVVYLIYLGLKLIFSKQDSYEFNRTPVQQRLSAIKHYASGFVVGASNPKAILFFTALFPQFIDANESLLTQYTVLASTFMVLELSWLCCYVYLGQKSSAWILARGRAKLFNRLTGGVFVGAGAVLSTASIAEEL